MPIPLPRLEAGATVGILGGGQLGRMLAMACAKLGLRAAIFAEEDSTAFEVAAWHYAAAYEDEMALRAFASRCAVLTCEFENIPVGALGNAQAFAPILPPPRAIKITQNRIREKRFLGKLGMPLAPFRIIESEADFDEAANFLGSCPDGAIIKRAIYGYDGKGQVRISNSGDLRAAYGSLGGACVIEQRVSFLCEISVIAVRGTDGGFAAYDLPLNHHQNGILKRSEVPSGLHAAVESEAVSFARRIGEALDYAGIFAVEFFVVEQASGQSLLVNEIAPRVHNSGHWTLDACTISQFENHIRAVAGWPLGSTARHSDASMTNLLGAEILNWRALLEADPAASLHLYGKNGIKEGRKLGHVTRITPRREKKA